jgi:hypothetical protein
MERKSKMNEQLQSVEVVENVEEFNLCLHKDDVFGEDRSGIN